MTKLREISLITETETLDGLNQPTITETPKSIIAVVNSVTRAEFFQGRQGGITPDISFVISAFDYSGEKVVKYDGKKYAIYRTYEADEDTVELYCQVEGGVTNG